MTPPDERWARRLTDAELELDLEAERAVPVASDEAKARIFAAVQVAIVQPPTPPSPVGPGASGGTGGTASSVTATSAGSGVALKGLVAVAVLAGVVGGGLLLRSPARAPAVSEVTATVAVAQPSAPPSARPAAPASVAAPTTTPPAPVVSAPPNGAPAPASLAARSAPRPAHAVNLPDEDAPVAAEPGRPHPVATPASTLGDEQALLEAARRALAAGDPRGALAAVSTHERRFAAGGLAEERDVLRIQAHARAGRMDEARAFAERFRARYPHSLLRAAVDYALGGGETP